MNPFRKKFKHAMRPYDVRDVVEKFGVGHAKLANSVKDLKKQVETLQKSMIQFVAKMEDDRSRKNASSGK